MNKLSNKNLNKKGQSNFILVLGTCLAIVSISALCEAAAPNSVGIIQKVIQNITDLIKTDGKIGLQIISAAAGSIAAAKTVSWQPLVVGAGGAGLVEVIFQAIG